MNKWTNWFPFKNFRPHQEETLCKIVETFEKVPVIFLQAPCGSGKSSYALALARYYKTAWIATVQRQLQDQYYQDFAAHLAMLKGKNNYACEKDWRDDYERKLNYTCHLAPCGLNLPSKKDVSKQCESEGICTYINTRNYAIKQSPITLMNFTNLLLFSAQKIPKRELVVFDECLPGDAQVVTDAGTISIKEIVEKKLPVRVLSRENSEHNGRNKRFVWQPITSYSKNPKRNKLLKITVKNADGTMSILRCTDNHRVLRVGRPCHPSAYVTASSLQIGDKLQKISGEPYRQANPYTPLDRETRQFLIGSLLGDGCLMKPYPKSRNYRFTIVHGGPQEEYARSKSEFMRSKGLLAHFFTRPNGGYGEISHRVISKTVSQLSELSVFYNSAGKKIIPFDYLVEHIEAEALAIWYQDDGSYQKGSLCLHTEGFDEEGNEQLRALLKLKFDVEAQIYQYKRRGYFFLGIRRNDSAHFLNLIRPFIHISMRYKLGESK